MTDTGSNFLHSLAPKEVAVLLQIIEAKTNKQIAVKLNCSVQVIKNYVRSLFDKSGMSNRQEFLIFCFHHGIVQCPCAALKYEERITFKGKPVDRCAREELIQALEHARKEITCGKRLLEQVKIK